MSKRQVQRALPVVSRVAVLPAGEEQGPVQPTAAEPCRETTPFPFVWSLDRSSNVGRALLAASRRLREVGSDSPQLDAAVLMAHVLGVGKTWLYAHPNRQLSEDEISRFEKLVRRRMNHEPVAYLVGYKPFYGLDITVDQRVLIPRPETELLVERALAYGRHLVSEGQRPRIVDVGTGSGAIAVALAVNLPEAVVYAVDVSEDSLSVAGQNVWRYGVGEQVQLLPGRLLEPVPEPVDIVVANLPYVATGELDGLPCEIKDFEPVLALDGGPDGLAVIRALLESVAGGSPASQKLRPGCRIFMEVGSKQGPQVQILAESLLPASRAEVLVDYASLDRLVTVIT